MIEDGIFEFQNVKCTFLKLNFNFTQIESFQWQRACVSFANDANSDIITRRVLVYDGIQEMKVRDAELVNFRNVTRLVFEDDPENTLTRSV